MKLTFLKETPFRGSQVAFFWKNQQHTNTVDSTAYFTDLRKNNNFEDCHFIRKNVRSPHLLAYALKAAVRFVE